MSQYNSPPDYNAIIKDIRTRLQAVSAGVNSLIVPGGTGQTAIDFGVSSLTFTAASTSSDTTVTHRLGRAPVAVVMTSNHAAVFGQIPILNWYNPGPTTISFVVNGQTTASWTGSAGFSWLAIG